MSGSRVIIIVILTAILIMAGFLRLWNLAEADVITDEALIGFRSIGNIDFFVSEFQKTPYDWFGRGDLPKWLKLSFHDHPPLIFLIQNIFFKIGGVNLWTLRLPFTLAGIASVYLVYLITKGLLKDNKGNKAEITGLLAAGLLAINSYHVWISRIGLQESVVIFFILLSVYFFLKALENSKYFIWLGVILGLTLLTKHTALILVPLFLFYLIIFRRDAIRQKYFYLGSLITLLLYSPVIIYNLKLFALRKHLDFQFSYLFGQNVSDWQYRLGRMQAGTFIERLTDLFPAIWRGITPVFGILALAGILYLVYRIIKDYKGQYRRSLEFLLITIVFYLLLFLIIGPRERFVGMIIPFLAIIIAYLLVKIYKQIINKKLLLSAVLLLSIIFAAYELFFTYNTALSANQLKGKENITYSRLKNESLTWGYNELDKYLEKEIFSKFYPAFQFSTKYKFLEEIKYKALAKAQKENKTPLKALIIYDKNIESSATVWYIFRRSVYGAWPILSADTYLDILETEGDDFFQNQRVEKFYFIKASKNTLLRLENNKTDKSNKTDRSDKLEISLIESGYESVKIFNQRIGEAFRVYLFN